MRDPPEVAASNASLTIAWRPVPAGDRRSHAPLIDSKEPGRYRKPLSATRARGAHPYLVMPEHTPAAREVLGAGPLLPPERTVLLTHSAEQARDIGTDWLRAYLVLPNYINNLLRSGFTPDDLSSVSDRLFDALIAWGDEDVIVRRVNEHRAAGADHVCVQALTADPREFLRDQWRRRAAALV
jgi:probable F420-dependent oxidoreductase